MIRKGVIFVHLIVKSYEKLKLAKGTFDKVNTLLLIFQCDYLIKDRLILYQSSFIFLVI
jgi:hypothetical protein